ncbi:hypothetical protein IID20_04125 [Patescibacteria group bacterium]|nr:hypothetical protein [Patescibacteria group bacterium]
MKKFLIVGLLLTLFVPLMVAAQDLGNGFLENLGTEAGYGDASLPEVIGNVIKILLSLLGLIAVVLLIAGGFIWMTSGGNEEKIKKAKQLMGAAIIGLIIVIAAYAIATFVIGQLVGVTA